MPVSLVQFFLFALLGGVIGRLTKGRHWLLLTSSILAIYWLQPAMPVRNLDFWLPTASLALIGWTWAVTRPADKTPARSDLVTAAVIMGIVLAIALTRYVAPLCCLTPTRPPALSSVVPALGLVLLLAILKGWGFRSKARWINLLLTLILAIFAILKTEMFSQAASAGLRLLNGQDPKLATPLDIRWLGFSYLAFRLIHTLRDRLNGQLPDLSLQEYFIYTTFFPAFSSGPIDRLQHFVQDLRKPYLLSSNEALEAGRRILTGIFNKFVLADSLALIALNATNAVQASSGGWLWILLYAYALRIYFDFAGYTDIAIGLGRLMGIRLPENFVRPYLKPNLTLFWNSWHITLAQWFRAYYFNPLTRALRASKTRLQFPMIIFLGQISTMLLIGLWHGVSWNFAIWGLWHGVGLFIHNRWAEFLRSRLIRLEEPKRLKWLFEASGILLTFHYVTLGWVWFALPSTELAGKVLLRLFWW